MRENAPSGSRGQVAQKRQRLGGPIVDKEKDGVEDEVDKRHDGVAQRWEQDDLAAKRVSYKSRVH